ncbi:Bcr/CflA family multidrug efflux MFS transporter [Pseudomonas sp. ABC1]|uniref:Bcr/CflA family multidrug efflux MFS transporter n=1 Tax=Pseudomonas sp. ABC1 TaxID=2748080 RepID=UPI0015C37C26|nr:Bcr/CflA family multidrug efflux MFS transporter [Pseudomonas sp. ABC1]QLF93378.1 Bcr/CflA family multidrug efflux MFS transporter [Pseudomonas sp. ABC1]
MPPIARPQSLIVLLAALVAFGPLSIDMYLPSLPSIGRDLDAGEAQVQMTISLFLGGLCLGMLFYGPLSDRFGRRRLLLGGIVLYLVASLGCALADDVGQLQFWRLLQALGGAAASVLARAIVRDLFPLGDAARVLSLMHLVTMLATLVAPLLGGYLMHLAAWRSQFLLLLGFAAICLLAVAWKIPETHPPSARGASLGQAFRAYGRMAREPLALGYTLCMGACFGGMFAFISASPFIYIEHFGVSPMGYAWLFALNILGIIVVTLLNARLVVELAPQRILAGATWVIATAGGVLALVGLSGWGGLPMLVVAVLGYISFTGMIGANCLACLLAAYPQQAGAAAGLAVAMQFGLGMLGSALVSALHDGTPLPMCLVLAGAGGLSLLACRVALRRF